MSARWAGVVALVSVVVVASGCTSSGSGGTSSSAPTTSGTSSGAAAQLAAKVQDGVASLTSAHLDVDAGALGGTITGNVAFAHGRTTASDLMLDQAGADVEVVTVGGTTYAKLPAAHNTTGKPWAKVSANSSNEFVRALAGPLSLTTAATSLGSVSGLLGTATTSVADRGAQPVDGVSTEHYALTVDPTKATGDLGSALASAGTKPLPVDLWLDPNGRPVQIKISIDRKSVV